MAPSVLWCRRTLQAAHDATGAPWWATITGATLALRCALIPFNVALLRNSLRLKLALPETARLGFILRHGGEAERTAAARDLRALFVRAGASPWVNMLAFPLLLPPLILSLFLAIHDVCLAGDGGGGGLDGTLWFPNLMEADGTALLPIASSLTWLANVEMGAGIHYEAWPMVRLAARLGAVASIPLVATLPSGVLLFWTLSNAFAIVRGGVVRIPRVRRALGVPQQGEIDAVAHHLPRAVGL